MKIITNGKLILEDHILEGFDLWVEGSHIIRIAPADVSSRPQAAGEVEILDAQGAWVAPGFIDIHADYIEHMAAPRPTSLMDFNLSLREAEKELISHGITTMYHSLSFYKDSEFGMNPLRKPENVEKFAELIFQTHGTKHLIRHKLHARFEIDNMGELGDLERYIKEKRVHLVSFMDHSPGQGQYRDLEMFRKTLKGYRNLSDGELDAIIAKHQGKEKMTLETIREMTALALRHGVSVASHDDDSIEKVELVKSFGTTISEFPITLEVARGARAAGLHTVAGAPNILLGGSHSGNLSAAQAILDGSIDILCSDYYPAALLHGVFKMHRDHGLPLEDMVKLVTLNPAQAVGTGDHLGSLAVGKIADLIWIDELEDGFPVITGVMVDGQMISRTHYRV